MTGMTVSKIYICTYVNRKINTESTIRLEIKAYRQKLDLPNYGILYQVLASVNERFIISLRLTSFSLSTIEHYLSLKLKDPHRHHDTCMP